jgi:translation initiation factor 3 subunit C
LSGHFETTLLDDSASSKYLTSICGHFTQDSDSDDDADSDDDKDDDDEWASDSDSDEESDDEEQGAYAELKGRARWLKKNTVTTKKVVKNKDERAKSRAEAKKAAEAAAQASESSMASKSVIPADNLTPSMINKKVKELIASRGRRGTDMRQVLRHLEALAKLSLEFGPRVEIPILMNVITAQFDLQRSMDDYMPTKTWKACANYLSRITDTLEEGYTLGKASIEEVELIGIGGGQKMKAVASSTDGAMAAIAADDKLVNPITGEAETEDERAERLRVEKEENMTEDEKKTIHVLGSYSLFLSTLEQEYVKSVQQISPHTKEFIARLRDESILVELLTKGQAYCERVNALEDAALLAQLRFEHIYYRHDSIGQAVDKANMFYRKYGEADMLHPACLSDEAGAAKNPNFAHTHPAAVGVRPNVPESTIAVNSADLISEIATFVYQHGTDRSKTRAMICHIYHHALHDRFTEARDLLLMSHLQDTIANAGDVSTMIMFNRMMVTLGMAAFRLGKIWSAHQALADTCSGRVRELLAQGVSTGRFNDKTPDEEKAEKRRQVPYHMHINLDLLEACHLISAMLLEVPNMASAEERRARVISRTFRKHHDMYQRQVFTGPPEQTRDFVMRASKALRTGDWKTCAHFLTDMDVWKLVPGEGSAAQIQKMLYEKIKLEGLRTYLFAFSNQYDSLSLTQLCGMFEMSKNEVHSVVSKMIINRDLYASWDQPTETIVMRKVEPTSLQLMALQFSEKAVTLVESNERLLDAASGSYGYKEGGDYHQDGRQNNQSGGGGGRGGFRSNTGGGGRGRSNGRGSGGRGDSGRGDGGRGRGRTGGGGGRGRGGNYNNRDGGRGGGGGRSRY